MCLILGLVGVSQAEVCNAKYKMSSIRIDYSSKNEAKKEFAIRLEKQLRDAGYSPMLVSNRTTISNSKDAIKYTSSACDEIGKILAIYSLAGGRNIGFDQIMYTYSEDAGAAGISITIGLYGE